MEPLVSEETKEILVSWVPGASRWEGAGVFSSLGGGWGVLMLEGKVSGVEGQVSGVRCWDIWG